MPFACCCRFLRRPFDTLLSFSVVVKFSRDSGHVLTGAKKPESPNFQKKQTALNLQKLNNPIAKNFPKSLNILYNHKSQAPKKPQAPEPPS